MGLDRVAQALDPGLHMGAEEAALLLEVAHRDVVAGDQEAHHLEDAGDVVLGLAARLVAGQAERGQVAAQRRQRLLVEEAGEVEGAVDEHLRLADAAEQRVELGGGGLRRGRAHRGHQRLPRRFQEAAGLGRLGDGDAELLQQRRIRRREPQPGQQAVQLGAGQFLGVVGAGEAQRADLVGFHGETDLGSQRGRSVMRTSSVRLCRSMTRQSPHIFSRSAPAPWKAGWPASLPIIVSMTFSVPKGLLQRMQR